MRPWSGLDGVRRVLCLGAHCDDIEIGCGGLLQSLNEGCQVNAVVFSGDDVRSGETRDALDRLAGHTELAVTVHDYRDGFFPARWQDIKQTFETLKADFDPELILTHHRRDGHQDHRIVAELTWNTYRDQPILEYEILKYDDDLGTPNLYHVLTDEQALHKAQTIAAAFPSQRGKAWMTEDTFLGLMRVRGVQAQARYAEAFYAPKLRI